jgi:hypothetical protein
VGPPNVRPRQLWPTSQTSPADTCTPGRQEAVCRHERSASTRSRAAVSYSLPSLTACACPDLGLSPATENASPECQSRAGQTPVRHSAALLPSARGPVHPSHLAAHEPPHILRPRFSASPRLTRSSARDQPHPWAHGPNASPGSDGTGVWGAGAHPRSRGPVPQSLPGVPAKAGIHQASGGGEPRGAGAAALAPRV